MRNREARDCYAERDTSMWIIHCKYRQMKKVNSEKLVYGSYYIQTMQYLVASLYPCVYYCVITADTIYIITR